MKPVEVETEVTETEAI